MLAEVVRTRLGKVFYGWWVVAACGAVGAFGGGVYFYGFSVFFLPIKAALNLSSASTSLVFSLSRAQGAVEGPVAGYLIDRFGARRMLTIGVVIVGVGYILLSQVTNFVQFLVVYLLIISLAFNASFSSATTAVVNNWFVRRKAFAMAVSMAAFGLGGAVIAPLLGLGVHHLGWRMTVAFSGVFLAASVTPFAQLLRPSPESMGLRPDGDQPPMGSAVGQQAMGSSGAPVDYTVREALRTPTFWVLSIATMFRVAAISTLIVHFVPIIVWKGGSEQTAAFMLGAMALFSIPMHIGIGWLGDRWSRAKVLAAGMVVGAVALLVLGNASSRWHLWAFIGLFSVVEGVSALNWALVGEFFGRRHFATLRGVQGLVYSWGMITMPVVAGAIYDRTESYSLLIWIFVATYGLATGLFLLTPRPRAPARLAARQPHQVAGG